MISQRVISWFQAFAFKCNLYRYAKEVDQSAGWVKAGGAGVGVSGEGVRQRAGNN